jgi:hypothetical protein
MNARAEHRLADATRWAEHNQAWLAAELARLRSQISARQAAQPPLPDAPVTPWPGPPESPPALDRIAQTFELSPFERDLLLLAAGVEIDRGLRELAPQGLSFSLAMAWLGAPHWDALSPLAPLRHWLLVDLPAGALPAHAPLVIDERVLHAITGVPALDGHLRGLLQPALHAPAADAGLADAVHGALGAATPPLLLLAPAGAGLATRRDSAIAAVQAAGGTALLLSAADLPHDAAELDTLARRIDRESALGGGTLVVWGEAPAEAQRQLFSLLTRLRSAAVLAGETDRARLRDAVARPLTVLNAPVLVACPTTTGTAATATGSPRPLPPGCRPAQLQFQVDAATWQQALHQATPAPGADPDPPALWQALRHASRGGLDGLAQRLDADTGFDDLVLPAATLAQLRAIAAQLRHRHTVHADWGFAGRGTRGLGLAALFAGESGTGKTLAAEAIAHQAGLDLYRVDLASTVSKYIGETEKNLSRLFDAAEASGAVLLFDEADALFGKRSEVKDSHDRYANIEIAYLLQRVESYRGLVILTSNLKSSLDKAFLRRIRFIVQFAFPDAALREQLWRRQLPAAAPQDAIDWPALAKAPLSGGHIRAAALQAAFAAADAGTAIDQTGLLQAVRAEFAKLERPWSGGGST